MSCTKYFLVFIDTRKLMARRKSYLHVCGEIYLKKEKYSVYIYYILICIELDTCKIS